MVWINIVRIEDSKFNNGTKLAYFELGSAEKYLIVSNKVLEFLNTKSIDIDDSIYVIKTFNKNKKPMFVAKMIKKNKEESK